MLSVLMSLPRRAVLSSGSSFVFGALALGAALPASADEPLKVGTHLVEGDGLASREDESAPS